MAQLTLRLVKGSPLTNAEVDNNFAALNAELITASNDIDTLESALNDIRTGEVPIDSPTFTGDVSVESTSALLLPSGVSSERPSPSINGQIRYNSELQMFEGYVNGQWSAIGGGISGAIIENDHTIYANYTISAGKNGGSFGPITIIDGIDVTVPDGSSWTVV